MPADDPCQYLDWDSDFFGRRVARVTANRLDPLTIEQVMAWCQSHAIGCLYFLGDADDGQTVRLVEDRRFRFVDIRLTLERQLEGVQLREDKKAFGPIRLCKLEDIPALRAIAKVSHRDSRFYYDPNFAISLCDRLYETWIEKSCTGYADAVLVAEFQGQPAGYITCHRLDPVTGQIGLVGVSRESQGHGLGRQLVNEAMGWFAAHSVRQVTVVTQGRNYRAQRLYQRCGFITKSVQLWYHQWFMSKGSE